MIKYFYGGQRWWKGYGLTVKDVRSRIVRGGRHLSMCHKTA